MSAEQAVNAPRFHHQLLPKNQIRHHPGLSAETSKQLSNLGYNLRQRQFGDLQLISNVDGVLDAASEKSGRGKAIVLNQ
jgi:gamma-glutamyltranspeptidase/glutathione hydrolase